MTGPLESAQVPQDSDAAPPQRPSWIRRYIFTTAHRTIGIQYLLLALVAVVVGASLSLLMRIHLAWPDVPMPFWGTMKPEDYLALVTIHGTLMVFFVLTTAPQSGFANLVLPEQIGSRQMALPIVNAISFWLTALSLLVLFAAFFVPGGAPISGWTSYPPFSAVASAGPGQALGMDFWLISIGIFCVASTLASVNMLTTIVAERCPGMTLGRMPLTVWSWLVASMITVLVFSVLFAAAVLLLCDRHLGTAFFVPMGDLVNGQIVGHGDGTPLLWLHLFWFFGHPEVYIAILPGMGITSSLLANFSRRPVLGYRLMVWTTLLIGFLGFLVWGHHMFVSGMNPYAGTAFALTTMAIAVPSTAKVLSWIGTIWGGNLRLTTPMLFSLGFLSLFIAGGITGPLLALPILDAYLHNTFFVVAHFHLIMGMAAIFSVFAGIYYWFPLISGRQLHEGLGKTHFWLTFAAAYSTFFPMHFAGLAGEPRHYSQLSGGAASMAALIPLQRYISISAIVLVSAQLIFLANLVWTLLQEGSSAANPWQATTLEWSSPGDEETTVVRGPYDYGVHPGQSDFLPQDVLESNRE
ncbi:MAG TPA: cbb3-type cytochrome c oxidase subunit I [Acidisarcina sp.]|nr:cbb3-type cytochrome c oxidase subunit I [Acidisarcina sp.]